MAERRGGFVLFEVLVAAAVAVVLIVLLIRMGADRRVGTAEVVAESETLDVARAVLAEASRRDALVVGERTGRVGDDAWRVEVARFECVPAASSADPDRLGGPCEKNGWILHRIRVEVTGPLQRRTSLETWRLGRSGG